MSRFRSNSQAILFAIAGFTLWVLTDTCVKLGTDAAIPPAEVAGVLSFTGTVFLLIKSLLHGGIKRLRPHNARHQLASAFLSTFSIFTCVLSLKHLPFIVFYIAVFTAPMAVSLLAAAVLREYLTRGKIIAIIAGFVGVMIAMDPFGVPADNMHGDWIGYTSVTINVLCFATLMILQRRIMQTETEESVAFFQILTQAIVFGAMTIFVHAALTPVLLLMLCCGGLLGILGNLGNIIATKHTTAATVAQFHYTQIISGALIGFLVWHEVPTLSLVIGSTIIIASGIYIVSHMRKVDTEAVIKIL